MEEIQKESIQVLINESNDRAIAIGPEGDFSLAEIEKALSIGFKSLSLGDKRLRTETAAVAACIASQIL